MRMYYRQFANPRHSQIRRSGLQSALIYTFFIALLLQNTVSLFSAMAGGIVPFAYIYIVKDILLLFMVALLLATKTVYKFGRVDQIALLIIIYVALAGGLQVGSLSELAFHLRFYLAPIVLFLLGRNLAPFIRSSKLVSFIITLAALYVVLGMAYLLLDREFLLRLGMGDLLSAKLGRFGREDAMTNGFPVNFFFYHGNGELTNRAFGVLFDPLASAFMGSVLLFFLIEMYVRTRRVLAGVLAFLVGLLVFLTLTRAIIIGVIIAALLYRFSNVRMRASVLIMGIGAFVGGMLVLHKYSFNLYDVLDPSTVAHLSVYLMLDYKSLLLGSGLLAGEVRGAESLYLTVLSEHGLLLFLLYLSLLLTLYLKLRMYFMVPYVYATVASMFVLALASLTTEHWFVFSSSALFWFVLGNTLTVVESSGFTKMKLGYGQ